jgi:hypothetical protein
MKKEAVVSTALRHERTLVPHSCLSEVSKRGYFTNQTIPQASSPTPLAPSLLRQSPPSGRVSDNRVAAAPHLFPLILPHSVKTCGLCCLCCTDTSRSSLITPSLPHSLTPSLIHFSQRVVSSLHYSTTPLLHSSAPCPSTSPSTSSSVSPLSHSHTHSLTHSLSHSHTHSLTH